MFVVDRDFFAWPDIVQCYEEDVVVKNLHESIWLAGMIDVVRAIATTAAIQTPAIIDSANTQPPSARAFLRFRIGNFFAGILGNFVSALKVGRGKAPATFDGRFCES